MLRKRTKKLVKFLIALLVSLAIFGIVMEIVGWETIQKSFDLFFSLNGLVIVLLSVLIALVGVLRWRSVIRAQGYHLPFRDLLKFDLVGFAISYLTPVALFGGEVFRIYFTKKKFQFLSWEKTVSSVVVDKIIDSTVFLVFLIVGLLSFAFYGNFPSETIGFFIFLVLAGLSGLLLFFYFKSSRRESILEWFLKILGINKEKIKGTTNGKIVFDTEREILSFFSDKKVAVLETMLISLVKYFLILIRCAFLVFILGGQFGIFKNLAIYGFSMLSALLPLPASIGGLEASEVFAFGALGLGASAGAVFSMVWRAADLLICLAGIYFFVKLGVKITEMKFLEFLEKINNHNSHVSQG